MVDIVDRRGDDPRTGLYSKRLVDLVRGGGRVLCVLNRKGRIKLLACAACDELTRCEHCNAAVEEADRDRLRCLRCGSERPRMCQGCGAASLRALRVGVSRAREELEALVGEPVEEVTTSSVGEPRSRVVVGTEAVLHRVRRADGVAFMDFDQELLAPRYRAGEQALALLARAGRITGPRTGTGRVLVQTRVPDAPALVAALHGDPARLADAERGIRERFALPPFVAMALVSGEAADEFTAGLAGVDVLGPHGDAYLIKAPDHDQLCTALSAAPRPPGRLRIDVDPVRA